jgi:hypothetical protein
MSKMVKNVKIGQKMSKLVKKCQNWSKNVIKLSKSQKMSKMVKKNGQKVKNCEMSKMVKNVIKMSKNIPRKNVKKSDARKCHRCCFVNSIESNWQFNFGTLFCWAKIGPHGIKRQNLHYRYFVSNFNFVK